MMQDIPRAEWQTFLARFSREHRAWLATAHRIQPNGSVIRMPLAPLEEVTLECNGARGMLHVRFLNGADASIFDPQHLRVQRRSDGAELALEVDGGGGTLARTAFRATVRAGEIDSIAPAELGNGDAVRASAATVLAGMR